jgi:hypothetical protein
MGTTFINTSVLTVLAVPFTSRNPAYPACCQAMTGCNRGSVSSFVIGDKSEKGDWIVDVNGTVNPGVLTSS